jgi:hypothetical protein
MKQINTTVERTVGGLLTLDGIVTSRPLNDALADACFVPGDRVSIVLTERLPQGVACDPPPPVPRPGTTWLIEFRNAAGEWVLPSDGRRVTVVRIDGDQVIYTGNWSGPKEYSAVAQAWTDEGKAYDCAGYNRARTVKLIS